MSRPLPANPGPLHHEIAAWLRLHARGRASARPRAELVAHMEAWATPRGLFPVRVEPSDDSEGGSWDRQVRALARECMPLGLPVESSGDGYFYGVDRLDRDLGDAQDLSRIDALRKHMDARRSAYEADARRQAGEPQPRPVEAFRRAGDGWVAVAGKPAGGLL